MKLGNVALMLVVAGLTLIPAVGLAVPYTPKPNPLAGPNKAVHDAQANVEVARKQMLVLRRKVEVTFEAKPDYKTTKAKMDKAKQEYDAATRKTAAVLEKTAEYKAQIVKRDKAQAIIDQETNPAPAPSGEDPVKLTDEQIKQATAERSEAGLAIRDMQKNAEDNDPTIIDLRQKYLDARAAWDAIQAQIDDAVKLDPGYSQAESGVTQAEAQLKQARDALAQAAQAQRQADAQAMKSHSQGGGAGPGR